MRWLIVIAALAGAAHADGGGDPAKTYAKASALIQRGKTREAMPLLRDAAEHGFATAQFVLGDTLLEGAVGVPKDERAAVPWFEKAVMQKNRAAQYALGMMYEEGSGGLHADWKVAAVLYEASAAQGFAQAQFAFGLTCEFQLHDRRRAIGWLVAAAKQGDGRAGWIAKWLSRPDMPQLKDQAALGAYIDQTIGAWMRASGGGTAAVGDTSIGAYQRERVRIFREQGDTRAADRCANHGSCY